jgi:glycosyltransferase involved in cell wall biosynthesis
MTTAANDPVVSVVIPCYNTHRYLGKTLQSVKGQSYQSIEVLVVDDGSTEPDTLLFLGQLGGEIRLLRQANKGLPAARNAGIRETKGEFILPLDSDDWLEPTFVEKLVHGLRRDGQASFAFCYIQLEGEANGVLVKHFNFFEQLFLNQLPYCLLYRKSVWKALGGYDETMRRGYEDWDFNIRLAALGGGATVVAEPLFHYRVSDSGMLSSTTNSVRGELWAGIRRKNADLYRLKSLFDRWAYWRHRPSTYPLWIYFIWLLAAKLLPQPLFLHLFRFLGRYSHRRRVSSRGSKDRKVTSV